MRGNAITHEPIARNATDSNMKGVMIVRSMDAAPATSTAAAMIIAARMRRGRRWMPSPLHMSDTSDTARPAAAMPWASELIDRGIMPRITRWAPTAAMERRTARRVRGPTSGRRETGRKRPYDISREPATVRVPLNVQAEKSS